MKWNYNSQIAGTEDVLHKFTVNGENGLMREESL